MKTMQNGKIPCRSAHLIVEKVLLDNIQSESQQPLKVNSLKGQTNKLGLCGKLTVFRLFLAVGPVETNGYLINKYGHRLPHLKIMKCHLHITVIISLEHLLRDHWSDVFKTYPRCLFWHWIAALLGNLRNVLSYW